MTIVLINQKARAVFVLLLFFLQLQIDAGLCCSRQKTIHPISLNDIFEAYQRTYLQHQPLPQDIILIDRIKAASLEQHEEIKQTVFHYNHVKKSAWE